MMIKKLLKVDGVMNPKHISVRNANATEDTSKSTVMVNFM